MKEQYFNEISTLRHFKIVNVSNPNPKFSGMGIIPGNILRVLSQTRTLIRFEINNTVFFARRDAINALIEWIPV